MELDKLQHADGCRFFDDGDFCTCGALEYARLQAALAENARLRCILAEAAGWVEDVRCYGEQAEGCKRDLLDRMRLFADEQPNDQVQP